MPRGRLVASRAVGDAIGQMLPTAVAVAISPFPIVAVVLMLVTRRGRVNGLAFLVGWLLGLIVVGAIVVSVASGADASDDGAPATWVSVLKLLLGSPAPRRSRRRGSMPASRSSSTPCSSPSPRSASGSR